VKGMDEEYYLVRPHLKELAKFIIPQRYMALDEGQQGNRRQRNEFILDGHATRAARTLSAGMLFGATNPTHRWLKLTLSDEGVLANRWLDMAVELVLRLMGRSNTYNALAANYLDLGVFGSTVTLLYEDSETLFRAYTLPAGEYRLAKDSRGQISYLSREFRMTATQLVERFGVENVSFQVKQAYERTGQNRFQEFDVVHLIEPNNPPTLPPHFIFRECYWEKGGERDMLLSYAGFYEKPFIAPRWELVGNNTYGVSPGMDALPDIIQLQHLTRRTAQGLDKQISPPLVLDQSLRNQPSPLMPNGVTYVPNAAQAVAKPLYTTQLPYEELQHNKQELKDAINGYFYNDLFRAILNLRTVRSATEVAEAKAETLVLLGPVVNRVEDEALRDLVLRVLGIVSRADILPPPPPLQGGSLNIEYDSILSAAQKAAGITNIERYMGAVGQVLPVAPETRHVTDMGELLREYGNRLNIPASVQRPREETARLIQEERNLAAAQQEAAIGRDLAAAAGALAE